MAYDDNNEIALWVNDDRKTDKHPHVKGQAKVDGVEYWVSGWKREKDAHERAPVLKLRLTPKDEQRVPQQSEPAPITIDHSEDDTNLPF